MTPSTVSNTYGGMIALQMTGLSSGETVVVQKYLDANANGVIDGADLLWQQFSLTDGQVGVLGGVTNINVPGDVNPTPGQITARVIFRNSDPVLNVIGQYAYKLSSPSGLFAPITNSFTITNPAYAQSLTGNVVNDGTNVPHAVVMLFLRDPEDNGPGSTVGGTVANNAGSYTIRVPTGTYSAVAFKSNYLGYLLPLPITVGSGATVSTNLALTNATRTLAGRLVDAAAPAIGLPGLFAHADGGGLVAVVTSDPNGNFTFPVGPGHWNVGAIGLEALGYINADEDNVSYDTTTGSLSGLTVAFPKANALFYGSVRDDQNQPLAGIGVDAENDDYSLWNDAFTDDNGNFVVGALGGDTWDVDVDDDDPALANYLFAEGSATNLSAGQAVLQNFTALRATNRITGHLQDSGGNPIPAIEVYAYAGIGGKFFYRETFTDANGGYALNVANGNWNVGVCLGCEDENSGYCRPNDQNLSVSNANVVANFTSPGQTAITTPAQLPEGRIDEEYSTEFTALTCVPGASWSATNPPSGLELSPGGELSGYPETPGSNYFYVQVSDFSGSSATKGFSLVIRPSTNGGAAFYYVNKLRSYRQTSPANVDLDSSQGPYNAYLGITQDSLGLVTNATCTLPTSVVKIFPPGIGALELQLHEAFASESLFEASHPPGDYTFAISSVNRGGFSAILRQPPPGYPNVPRILNYAPAQIINPNHDFLLEWDAFSGGTDADSVRLLITDSHAVPAFKLWEYPEPVYEDWLARDDTVAVIPAGLLEAGREYLGVLQFLRVIEVNEVADTNAYGVAYLSAQTVFRLATLSAVPTLSQPERLSATQFRFLLSGLEGQAYSIEKSTNVNSTNWTVLFFSGAPAVVIDSSATNSRSFYRARAFSWSNL